MASKEPNDMNPFRDEKELTADALRRAYQVPSDRDQRFHKLLVRIKEAQQTSGMKRAG